VRTQLPYEYYVLPFCNQGVDLNTQEALNLGEVRDALSITCRLESPPPQTLNPKPKAPYTSNHCFTNPRVIRPGA
jgi:hypothetical protein